MCHFNDTLLAAKIDAFAYVPSYNNSALKHAVAKFGPAAVSINVSPLSFKFYSHGVYHDADCCAYFIFHQSFSYSYLPLYKLYAVLDLDPPANGIRGLSLMKCVFLSWDLVASSLMAI